MTAVMLLEALKEFVIEQTKDIILPVKGRPSEPEQERPPGVYKMHLPNKEGEIKQIPYIVLQFITGKDDQVQGESPESECRVRIIVATYSENREEGAMDVLNILTRLRVALLKDGVIGGHFMIKKPLEYIIYPDELPPFHMGEMQTIWELPEIEREVSIVWQ